MLMPPFHFQSQKKLFESFLCMMALAFVSIAASLFPKQTGPLGNAG
jgi:hypothetical protein